MQETCGNTHLEVVTYDVKVLLFKQLMTWNLVCWRQKKILGKFGNSENSDYLQYLLLSRKCSSSKCIKFRRAAFNFSQKR